MNLRYGRKSRMPGSVILSVLLLVLIGSALFVLSDRSTDGAQSFAAPAAEAEDEALQAMEKYAEDAFKIFIDPGHGGKDPGTTGASGVEEKISNLALAAKVYALLSEEPSFEPRMSRTDDTFVDLDERALVANAWGADAFISIHGNSYEDPSISGTETYFSRPDGMALARTIHDQLVQATGLDDRGVREQRLQVLALSEMPAILIETGYLSNPNDEAAMLNEQSQSVAAQAIVDGLKQYFDVE